MALQIGPPTELRDVSIRLPASKSISNRALIIRCLSDGKSGIHNLSEAFDTTVLKKCLDGMYRQNFFDVADSGTAMRFLIALFAITAGRRILTGSPRMQQRPVGPLVDALRRMGASINYLKREGYPPLEIEGQTLKGGRVEIRADISSQFISALMMIAPVLDRGLHIFMTGNAISTPYLNLTASVMSQYGVHAQMRGKEIIILPQQYISKEYHIEADWSAAAFWYEMLALSGKAQIILLDLQPNTAQGDSVIMEIMNQFGVETKFNTEGAVLQKKGSGLPVAFNFDFTACPDLAQALAASCAGLRIPAKLKGLDTLRIKETDRIAAMCAELGKTGLQIICNENYMELSPSTRTETGDVSFSVHNDHRMAMSLAPLCIVFGKFGKIVIDDESVVAKSYPAYWSDLKMAGFELIKV